MDPLTYARAQMGISLAFHMIFAAAGVALPVMLVIADVMFMRSKDPDWRAISERMAKGTSILFAVGAVSGTVLSFELGLLWPSFMGTFGEVIGMPFALEGFAFFTEAIFLGIYLYGRRRITPRQHLGAGIVVAASGAISAFFVILVNAFMNAPRGFTMEGGKLTNVDPLAAMFSGPWAHQVLHGLLACYQATAFALAGLHAAALLRHRQSGVYRKAFAISLALAAVTALAQPLVGDRSAKSIAELEPVKLAAAEGHFETASHAPLHVGGWADVETRSVRYGFDVPSGLSFLAFGRRGAEVMGLDRVPREDWPPVAAVHASFDVMVGAGSILAALSVLAGFLAWRKKGLPDQTWFLWAMILASPLGIVAMEAGWLTTELGRQPWIVRGAMRTKDAVTPFPHLAAPFWIFGIVYAFLGLTVVYLLYHQFRKAPVDATGDAPHSVHP